MTIFKKNNLQDIIKNIKKKKKFSGGFLTHPTEDDIEEQNIAMESNNIKEYKKKLLDNIFNKFEDIINTLNSYDKNTLDIDSFIKLKKINNDYITFYDILKKMSKIRYKRVKNSITGKIPFRTYSEIAKKMISISYQNITQKPEEFYKSDSYLFTKLNITSNTFNKLDNYKEVFDEISSITKRYDVIKKKDDKDDTDIESLYTGIYKITYSLYVIIYIEKNNQYKYFIFKNEIEKNININKEYYSISEIKYDKDSNVDINAINIGEILIKSLDKIEEYNIYYKKKEEIIKDKINECNDPGVKNNIDFGTIQIRKYNDFIDTTNGTLLLYNSSKLIENIEKNTSLFVNITKNMKECALFSLAFYNSIKEYNKFYSKEYYKNEDNILPNWKLLKNGDNNISIGFTNFFIRIENIIAENDRNIQDYILKYLNIPGISYKKRDNNNSKLKNIINGYEIIKLKIEKVYNNFEDVKIREDFEKNINLAEYDYYNNKINNQSTTGGYLYYNEPQYIEQKYENINEKILKENAITVIKEINNYIPIFTGGGGIEETKKFIRDKISLLESDLKKLTEDIKKLKGDTSEYTDLQNEEKKEYYNLTKLSSLKDTEKVDNDNNKAFEENIKIFDIKYKEIEKLAKIIERNIIGFYQSTKITEDIDSAKKKKEDKGAEGSEGAEGAEGSEGSEGATEGDAKGAIKGDAKGDNNKKKYDDDDGIHNKAIKFEIIIRLFNMVITFIILVLFLIYISIFCISLLNMLIYIILVINDILINIFNDDVTIYESLGYKIVKYIDVQQTNVPKTQEDFYKDIKELVDIDKDFYNYLIANIKSDIDDYVTNTSDATKKKNLKDAIARKKDAYDIVKYERAGDAVDAEINNYNTDDKGSLNKEPYFYALFQQNIIYIMTDFLTAILFVMIILIFLYIVFLLIAFIKNTTLDGDINNNKTVQLSIMFFVFLLFITINIVLYKYLFSDIIFEKLVDIKTKHNIIDSIIFKLFTFTHPFINKYYCEELRNNINDMDNINTFFKEGELYFKTSDKDKKIVQMAFLYCLYSYLYEIVPNSNKSAISLIHNFIIADKGDKIRDGGYLSFASFLSNSSSANAIKKYYLNLGIFSDDAYLNTKDSVQRKHITDILKKKIAELNLHLLNIPEQKIPLILLGLYFLINLILNFIGLIVISYLIAKDKDLAPDLRLFPLQLSEVLYKILLNIPFVSTLFKIIPV